MHEPAWKKLVEDLKRQGHESPYLDRLRQRLPATGMDDLAGEILREMASALGRAEDKVNAALAVLDVDGRKIDRLRAEAGDPEEIAARITIYNERREAAKRALWELRVHREALGFYRNHELAELYPIPPPKR